MAKIDKKALRREEARALQAARPAMTPELADAIRLAPLPFAGAWVATGWQRSKLAVVGIARRRPDGDLAAVLALVDLGCLGVKTARVYTKIEAYRFSAELERIADSGLDAVTAGQVAQVVREASRWSASFGLKREPVSSTVLTFLGGIEADPAFEVPLGEGGKPIFIAGPQDDTDAIMAQLTAAVGPGGFEFFMPA